MLSFIFFLKILKTYLITMQLQQMMTNPNQTAPPNFDSIATIKAILEQSEKTKTERTNTELKLGNKDVPKFFTPGQQDVRTPSPTNK